MWTVQAPECSAETSFTACISRVKSPALAARLEAAKPCIVDASNEFDYAARKSLLHEIQPHCNVNEDITCKEMDDIYTNRMAKIGSPGRYIYDEIFMSPPGGRCPLCMQRNVSSLDHYLPKAHFPSLAVVPLNLVPACFECNKVKSDTVATSAAEAPLHPYYDDLGDATWLSADVVQCKPSALRFYISRSEHWDDVLAARVEMHFRRLGLA